MRNYLNSCIVNRSITHCWQRLMTAAIPQQIWSFMIHTIPHTKSKIAESAFITRYTVFKIILLLCYFCTVVYFECSIPCISQCNSIEIALTIMIQFFCAHLSYFVLSRMPGTIKWAKWLPTPCDLFTYLIAGVWYLWLLEFHLLWDFVQSNDFELLLPALQLTVRSPLCE